jgi:hypothetical protein
LNASVIVDVGHWSFGITSDKGFVSKWNQTDNQLTPVDINQIQGYDWDDPETNHINAVEVVASVQSPTFFSRFSAGIA